MFCQDFRDGRLSQLPPPPLPVSSKPMYSIALPSCSIPYHARHAFASPRYDSPIGMQVGVEGALGQPCIIHVSHRGGSRHSFPIGSYRITK